MVFRFLLAPPLNLKVLVYLFRLALRPSPPRLPKALSSAFKRRCLLRGSGRKQWDIGFQKLKSLS